MLLENDENQLGKLQDDGTIILDEQKLRKWLSVGECPSDCLTCKFVPTCFGLSCPAKRFLLPRSEQCGYEIESFPYIVKLLDQSGLFEWIENKEVVSQ